MNPEAKTFAQDIIEHAKLVQNILADKTFDDYTNDINTPVIPAQAGIQRGWGAAISPLP